MLGYVFKKQSVRIGVVLALLFIMGFVSGCAEFGTWKPEVRAKLDAFGQWADEWVGGAVAQAPLVIAAVEAFTGKTVQTEMAALAVKAAQSALGSYHAVAATGSGDAATAQANLLAAIEQIKATVGDVQEIVDGT